MAEAAAHPQGQRAESAEAGLVSPERLIFFSDAVIAIAMTLLALELPVPTHEVHGNEQLLDYLREHSAEYLAFLISFTAIAMHWLAHQRVFRYATGLVLGVIRWDLVWLLMLVVMPFTTKMLTSEVEAFQVQFTMYAANQTLAGLFLVLALRSLRRNRLLSAETPPTAVSSTMDWMLTVIAVFALSIPLAFWTPWATLSWVLIPVVRIAIRYGRRLLAAGRETVPPRG